MSETLKEVLKKYEHLDESLTNNRINRAGYSLCAIFCEVWKAAKAHLAEPCYRLGDQVEHDGGRYRVGLISEVIFNDAAHPNPRKEEE